MHRVSGLVASALVLASLLAGSAVAQSVVYSNQAAIGSTSFSAFTTNTEWDDLQLSGGGLLSELSLVTRRTGGGPQFASGFFDLRVFDEAGNFPQGDVLGVVPFSGTFPATPAGPHPDGVLIELTDLESLNITLPGTGRIGVGVRFNQSGWGLIPSGPAEIGSSPGGNWLGTSPTERSEFGDGLPYRVAVVDPVPVGPGIGNYTLFETALATPDDPVSNSGAIASDAFFRAIGFQVERTTQVSQVGAFMDGSGTIFAAIVETDNIFAAPVPHDLSGTNVLASTLIELDAGADGADVVADLDATLEPGTYALVFGSGQLGASGGQAFIRNGHIPNGDWSPYGIRQSDGVQSFSAGAKRYFISAQSAPGTVQVRPTFDVLAEVTEGSFPGEIGSVRLIDGEENIIVDANPAPEPNEHAVLEFSLENVPTDRQITAVTLELDLDLLTTSGPLQVDILGYAGDGAAQRTDVIGPQTVVGQTNFTTSSLGVTSVSIDPVFVAGLLGQASHLGLSIAPAATGNFRFATLESGQFGEPPLLTISLGPPPIGPLPGDYNNDGTVDAADYVVWRKNNNTSNTLPNDPTPGTVDDTDYDFWLTQFGNSLDAGSGQLSGTQVPEPASWVGCLCFALAGASHRELRKHRAT